MYKRQVADLGYPVVFVYLEDLAYSKGLSAATAMSFLRSYGALGLSLRGSPAIVVLVGQSFEAFTMWLWLLPALHILLEEAQTVLFVTEAEVPAALSLFTSTLYDDECVGRLLNQQLSPFPRLHFHTLASAMGAEVEDGEIIIPALTVGPAGGSPGLCPLEKFQGTVQRLSPFFLADCPVERVVPALEGFAGVSVITPAKLLAKLILGLLQFYREAYQVSMEPLGSAMPSGAAGDGSEQQQEQAAVAQAPPEDIAPSWKALFGDDVDVGNEDMELEEAEANINDLLNDLVQYLGMKPGDC